VRRIRFFLIRLVRYEFWPFWLFYLPMYFYGIFLALKAGSFTYFTATNPGMKYGGAFDMLKFDILSRIDPPYTPRGTRIALACKLEDLPARMAEEGIGFPLIAKPDIGERGKGVELVEDLSGLLAYLDTQQGDIILQEYINWPVEIGVLYYRYPDGSGEEITSVVIRDFLKVKGDGTQTLYNLMQARLRAQLKRKYLPGSTATGFTRSFLMGKKSCWSPSAIITAEPASGMAII
jgi:hypothetical protein